MLKHSDYAKHKIIPQPLHKYTIISHKKLEFSDQNTGFRLRSSVWLTMDVDPRKVTKLLYTYIRNTLNYL